MASKKFRLDDIIQAESKDLAKQFECAICLHVAADPAVQTPCGHVYCRECLAPCELCPLCREPVNATTTKPLHEVNKLGMRMMLNLKVRCPNTEQLAWEDWRAKRLKVSSARDFEARCTWQGTYGDLLAKHFCECPLQEVLCPHGCGAVVARRLLEEHLQSCPNFFEHCVICGERIRCGTVLEHNTQKARQHVEILKKKLRAVQLYADQKTITASQFRAIQSMLQSVATPQEVYKLLQKSESRITANVDLWFQNLLTKHAVWEIKNVKDVLKVVFFRRELVCSQTFSLGGIEGFRLFFYPHLKQVGIENHPGHITVELELKVEGFASGQIATAGSDFDWSKDTLMMKNLYFNYKLDEMIVTAILLQGTYIRKVQAMSSHSNGQWTQA